MPKKAKPKRAKLVASVQETKEQHLYIGRVGGRRCGPGPGSSAPGNQLLNAKMRH
jgi:hypothetical protein